jgi:hypothetical protein
VGENHSEMELVQKALQKILDSTSQLKRHFLAENSGLCDFLSGNQISCKWWDNLPEVAAKLSVTEKNLFKASDDLLNELLKDKTLHKDDRAAINVAFAQKLPDGTQYYASVIQLAQEITNRHIKQGTVNQSKHYARFQQIRVTSDAHIKNIHSAIPLREAALVQSLDDAISAAHPVIVSSLGGAHLYEQEAHIKKQYPDANVITVFTSKKAQQGYKDAKAVHQRSDL